MPCEVAIWAKPRNVLLPAIVYSKQWKQGDVIEVKPFGFNWGTCDLGQEAQGNPNGNHSIFRIVKFTNVSEAQAQVMLEPELDLDPLNPSPYLQLRARYLDKSKIQSNFPAFYNNLIDDLRTNPTVTVNATAGQINQVISVTDRIAWP